MIFPQEHMVISAWNSNIDPDFVPFAESEIMVRFQSSERAVRSSQQASMLSIHPW